MAEPQEHTAALLALARQLKKTAATAGRPDVAAKADEVIALIGGPANPARDDKANAIVRILDGLGF